MKGPGYPQDARGWMAFGLFFEVNVIIIGMIIHPQLAEVDLFKSIAQAIILQGFLQLAAAFYFTASKTGSDLAATNARIAEQAASGSNSTDPQPVKVVNDAAEPVPTTEAEESK